MGILQLNNLILYLLSIPKSTIIFYFLVDLRILGEDFTQQKLLWKRKCFNFCHSHINKLRFYVVAHIIITNYRFSSKVMRNNILNFFDWLLEQVVTDTNFTLHYEVHLLNNFFFIINYIIIRFVTEKSRKQTKWNIIQKLWISLLIFYRLKKVTKARKNIVK